MMNIVSLFIVISTLIISTTSSSESECSYEFLVQRSFERFQADELFLAEQDLRDAMELVNDDDDSLVHLRANLALIHYLTEKASASECASSSSGVTSAESLKNLAWYGQVRNSLSEMNRYQGEQVQVILNRQSLSSSSNLSFSFFDYGLTGKVCRSYQEEQDFDVRTQYLDMLKRGLTYYLYEELPHDTMPLVDWDLHYRMRDSQNNPPSGYRHGFGITTLPLGALDLVQYAIQDVIENNVPGDVVEAGVWRGTWTETLCGSRCSLCSSSHQFRDLLLLHAYQALMIVCG